MSWENDGAGYLAELARSPGGQQPATIGQVWDSEWKRGGLDTIGGVGEPYGNARSELVTAIEGAAGKPIEAYAADKGVRLGSGVTQADDIRLLGALADTLPEDRRKAIEPLKDIRLNAAKKAQKIEADADEIGNATYGLTAHATGFIAGVARMAADPVNVAAMVATAPLGAARGASLLATIGREAGANAAAQAMVEPVIEPQRERLGLDSGFGRAAGNILEAGIGGGVLSGLFHVAGRGLRTLRGERPAEAAGASAPAEGAIVPPESVSRTAESGVASVARPDPAPSGPLAPVRPVEQFAPDDFHAAGDLAERDHIIDVMAPVDTAEGRFDHVDKVNKAAARIDGANHEAVPIVREPSLGERLLKAATPLDPENSIVFIHADKVALSAMDSNYVEPKRANAKEFIGSAPADWQPPHVNVRVDNRGGDRFEILDGIHRWAAMRDINMDVVPVEMNSAALKKAKKLGLVADKEMVLRELRDPALQPPTAIKAATLEGRAAAAERASPVVVDVAPPKKTNRGRSNADPQSWSLNEFLASKGGLKPDPELLAIFGTEKGPFVPGFGPLVRKGGTTLDDALKSAKEAGYLFDPRDLDGPDNGTLGRSGRTDMGLTPNDLLDRLDAENRGQKTYRHGRVVENVIDEGQEAHAIVSALEKELFDTGGGHISVDQVIADRVVEIVRREKETDLLVAFERVIMENAERYQELAKARAANAELAYIPGWDADEPGAASRNGAADPGERRQAGSAGQDGGGADGQTPRTARDSAGAPRQLGDPARAADAARAMEDAGGDFEITLQNPDGTTRTLRASDALREVEDDARAADELNACIIGSSGEIPF